VCAIIAVLIWRFFPLMAVEPDETQISAVKILTYPLILVNLVMSLLALTAMFTSYTYLADLLTRIGHFTVASTGWILMGFGVAGIIGNAFAGRFVDVSPLRAAMGATVIAAVAMAAFPSLLGSHVAAMITLAIWGAAHAAGFVTNHVRTIRSAPAALQDLTASLNVSIFNAGIGLGAVVGGKVIDAVGLREVGVAGAMSGVLALIVAAIILPRANASRLPAPTSPIVDTVQLPRDVAFDRVTRGRACGVRYLSLHKRSGINFSLRGT